MHSIQIAVPYHEYNVLCPQRIVYVYVSVTNTSKNYGFALFRKEANDNTVATPLKFNDPFPPSMMLLQDALMTMASVPLVLGAASIA